VADSCPMRPSIPRAVELLSVAHPSSETVTMEMERANFISGLNVDELAGPVDSAEPDGNGLIPKPSGEAGRPNRGGYSVRKKLVEDFNWTPRAYQKLTVSGQSRKARNLISLTAVLTIAIRL
jgi:hypothetical protein